MFWLFIDSLAYANKQLIQDHNSITQMLLIKSAYWQARPENENKTHQWWWFLY
jgi:hypothetical protein